MKQATRTPSSEASVPAETMLALDPATAIGGNAPARDTGLPPLNSAWRSVDTGAAGCADEHPVAAERLDARLDRAAQSVLVAATCGWSPASAVMAWADWAMHLAISPGKWQTLTARAWQDWLAHHELGSGATDPIAEAAGDPRFKAQAWSTWPFSQWRDGFLRTQAWWSEAASNVRGVDAHHEEMTRFYARQWLDAMSPSNFPWTNPQVLAKTVESGGANFVAGLRNWFDDIEDALARGVGIGNERKPALEVGRDLAITPGAVVWRNDLLELIQYTPSTARVKREPILIVPSWILKYYILDLQPHNSLIRFLVDAGYTVFAISWKNPDAGARNLGLNDYLERGLLAALARVRSGCDGAAVHALGYCLGGTLLAIAAAALARDAQDRKPGAQGMESRDESLRSISLLAAETDFSEPGELGLFIDASELAALDALMWEQGYLDGAQMAAAFQVLNSRDLIWSRMMSEYLLGTRSKPDDMNTWNADTTRMPYRMHSEYLNRLFLHNDLAEGRYCVAGRPVALSDVRQPWFVVGTERDHVSPWRSVYKLHLLTHGDMTFLLTSRGHNAGIVSPPGLPDRHYRVASRQAGDDYRAPDDFLANTEPTAGSWWECLAHWLAARSGPEIEARKLPAALEAAPGSYVKAR